MDAAFCIAAMVKEELGMCHKHNKPNNSLILKLQKKLHFFESSPQSEGDQVNKSHHSLANMSAPANLNFCSHCSPQIKHEVLVDSVDFLIIEQKDVICSITSAEAIKNEAVIFGKASLVDLLYGWARAIVCLPTIRIFNVESGIV